MGFCFLFGPVLGLEMVCSTLLVFKFLVLFSFGSFGFQGWGCLSYLGLPLVSGFRGALGTSSVQLGDDQHRVFFGISISRFPFVLQQLF